MKTLDIRDAIRPLAEYAREADASPVVVTEGGRPVAAVIAVGGSDWESLSLSTNPEFVGLIEESRRRYREEGGVSADEVRRRLGVENGKRRP